MHHQFPFANHNHTLHFLCFYWSLNSQISGSSKFLPVTWEGTEIYESYLILQQMLIWWIQTVMLKAAVSSHCFLEQKSRTTTIAPKMLTHVHYAGKMSLAHYFWEATIRRKGASGQTRGAPEVMDSSVFGGAKGRLILKEGRCTETHTHKLPPPPKPPHTTHKSNYTHTSTN